MRVTPPIDRVQEPELRNSGELLPIIDHFRSSDQDKFAARLRLLWEHRAFLLRVVLWTAVLTAISTLFIHNKYASTTRLMPPDNQGSASAVLSALGGKNSADSLGMLAGDLLGAKNNGEVFQGILRSRTVADRLIDRFDLRRVYWDKRYIDARKQLDKNTDIEEDRKSGIITITVTDRDPQRAAMLAKAYVEELDKNVALLSTSAARRERIFLESRLQVVKNELETTAKNFSQFSSKTGAIDVPEQGKAMVEAGAILEGQLIAARATLNGLKQIYTENNPRVKQTTANVQELEAQLKKMTGSATLPVESDELPTLKQLPALGVTWADYYRQEKVAEAVFEYLTKQYELAKVEEAKEIPSVKVLDVADVPERKVSPPRTLLVLASTILGFIGACSFLLLRDSFEQRPASDPTKELCMEIIAAMQNKVRLLKRRRVVFASRNG